MTSVPVTSSAAKPAADAAGRTSPDSTPASMRASASASSPEPTAPAVSATSILNRFIPISATDLHRGLVADASRLGFLPDALEAVLDCIQDAVSRETRSLERAMGDAYAAFNPDRDTLPLCHLPRDETDASLADLERRLTYLFDKANFERLDDFTIEAAIEEAKTHGLRIRIRADRVDKLILWIRGRGVIYKRLPHWKSPFRGRNVKCRVFHRLGVLAKLKDDPHVHLKLFRDVPVADIEALLPHAEVGMNWLDRVKVIGGGAGALGTVVVKLFQGALTLALVSKLIWLIAMAIGLMAGRTFLGYRRSKSMRDAQRTRHLYYQTLANNGGVISWLVDMIAQEEEKEAMVAYAMGQAPAVDPPAPPDRSPDAPAPAPKPGASEPPSTPDAPPPPVPPAPPGFVSIRRRAEVYLHERYSVHVDFDESDAVETLDRFGLWDSRDLRRTLVPVDALAELRSYLESGVPAWYHEQAISRR